MPLSPSPPASNRCRFCGAALTHTVVDLGMSPLCESFVPADRLEETEPVYPLLVFVCDRCYLVQLPAHVGGTDIFSEYAYFSSYSDSWLAHAERYAETMIARLRLDGTSQVVEVASNDGYLLQYFSRRGIASLGIEPAANVARAALAKGIPTLVEFFGREAAARLVARGIGADLLIGNNVLAQVPELNDFVAGLKLLLRPGAVLTLEFPHLMRLVQQNQFDTIYHEHYSYFSFTTAATILAAHRLEVFDVEELPTHGGSLRLHASHAGDEAHPPRDSVAELRQIEDSAGMNRLDYFAAFADRVRETRRRLLDFLETARRDGKRVAGYGAPGKGNTLLNYCRIGTDLVEYTVDRNPYKQGRYLPGSHIPIYPPERIDQTRPDYLLILPWNLRDEIVGQLQRIRVWGGRFVIPIPTLEVLS
jgi:C-methyltransferase C-terminal domain/Putative zinc binding domain/Methyltransferase domain